MIEFLAGDILKADAEALVNTVNCVGFMGRGIAAQFKRAFPENYEAYRLACGRGEVRPGAMFVFETGRGGGPRFVINFPTKRHWRGESRIEDIDSGLVALIKEVERRRIRSIAVPPLGCGLGGLTWRDVRPRIEHAFSTLPEVRVLAFEPEQASRELRPSGRAPAMTEGRAILIRLIDRYLAGLMDPFVTLLEVHKLLYFAQEGGQRLRLRYAKGPYGPYAENLRHVLSAIEGYFLSGYLDGGDAPDKQLQLLPGALEAATAFLAGPSDGVEGINRVSKLVDGYETPFGMELLSTVHWVATRERPADVNGVVAAVHAWGERKRRFSPEQIWLALSQLELQGWV
ncbi:MAG TPA: macro domain-containing protein [Myxococcales bacterium]|nr:macro domain-containing protein [Myxococcales bacterium]